MWQHSLMQAMLVAISVEAAIGIIAFLLGQQGTKRRVVIGLSVCSVVTSVIAVVLLRSAFIAALAEAAETHDWKRVEIGMESDWFGSATIDASNILYERDKDDEAAKLLSLKWQHGDFLGMFCRKRMETVSGTTRAFVYFRHFARAHSHLTDLEPFLEGKMLSDERLRRYMEAAITSVPHAYGSSKAAEALTELGYLLETDGNAALSRMMYERAQVVSRE